MASPMSMGGSGQMGWGANSNSQQMFPGSDFQEPGLQTRSMGLKVHYTFDKDGKINCLARAPQTLQVQTIPIDDTNSIGVLDLRICVQAVIDCSPELASQDGDYTIYALDYSEPDTPLVGQGMLSWAMETLGGDMGNREPKMVTGRVTKNLLGVFGGGNRETLEVKLKLTSSAAKVQRPDGSRGMDMQSRPMDAMTPTGVSEWNSFIQNNPQIGQPSQNQRGASPALSHASYGPPMLQHRDSFGQPSQQSMPGQDLQRIAPVPVDPQQPTGPSSRPSSRASNRAPRKKKPTGRPRGRPKKRPLEGNTSGYEDGTEGDEGPVKKRATTIKVDKNKSNPFGGEPESLRVAASTSGSLRSFRPIGMSHEIAGAGSHLQDVPRAPTPIPDGSFLGKGGRPAMSTMRRASIMSQELSAPKYPAQYESRMAPFQEDGRSPESAAPTPAYSEGSHADIGSSPPVTRNSPFIQSSPPPSSPILPPMPHASIPQTQLPTDLSFMDTDMDDLFADEALQNALRDSMPSFAPAELNIETRTDASGVPMLVFEMQDGPDGQNMVHIRNHNSPHPTSTPAGPFDTASYMRNYNTPHPTSTPAGPPENQAYMSNYNTSHPPSTSAGPPENLSYPTSTATGEGQSLPQLPPAPPKQEAAKAKRPASKKGRAGSPAALAPTPPTTDAIERSNSPMAPPQLPQDAEVESNANVSLDQNEGPTKTQTSQELPGSEATAEQSKPKRVRKRNPRPLNRSQSASAMVLPTLAASEPAGPSSLSQTTTAAPAQNPRKTLQRAASTGPLGRPCTGHVPLLPAPAEERVAPLPASDAGVVSAPSPSGLMLPEPVCPPSDALPPAPSSPGDSRSISNKNAVKRNAIKQRLESAILKGEMPPFCNNCGAIETPTWRKIWVQDFKGTPGYIEYSEKPGKVTAIEILTRDAEEKPTSYRLIKKTIGPEDDTDIWRVLLLCNPCGIWLAKSKCHRPQSRWQMDASRRGQERRKRSSTSGGSRPRKPKAKGDGQVNPTSEAYLLTDAMGSVEPSSPKMAESNSQLFDMDQSNSQLDRDSESRVASASRDESVDVTRPGSKSSEASLSKGTVKSPIDVELDAELGTTKRLLFPSPRKDGSPVALGELSVNIVQTTEFRRQKEVMNEKDMETGTQEAACDYDDLEDLFRSPAVARPCTPPPTSKATAPASAFKTPTRPTPSHRPITRSVSRSIQKSVRSLKSPIQFSLESPSKSVPSSATESARRRRSPRNHDVDFSDFNVCDDLGLCDEDGVPQYPIEGSISPVSREIMELLEKSYDDGSAAGTQREIPGTPFTMEEMRAMGIFDLYRSPRKKEEDQKSDKDKPRPWQETWYTGSADNYDNWMREHGPNITNYHD